MLKHPHAHNCFETSSQTPQGRAWTPRLALKSLRFPALAHYTALPRPKVLSGQTGLVLSPWEHGVLWHLSLCAFHDPLWNAHPLPLNQLCPRASFCFPHKALIITRMSKGRLWWYHCLLGTYCARHLSRCFNASHLPTNHVKEKLLSLCHRQETEAGWCSTVTHTGLSWTPDSAPSWLWDFGKLRHLQKLQFNHL